MERLECCGGEDSEGVCGVPVGKNEAGTEESEDAGMEPKGDVSNKKDVVIGDFFKRYMMEIPVPNEAAMTIASILFESWIEVFGPPVRLSSDRWKPIVSSIVQNFCSRVGTQKIFTTSYYPQADGCLENFNATLCMYLA